MKQIEKWVDIIREWHTAEAYPSIRPLAKKIVKALQDTREEAMREVMKHTRVYQRTYHISDRRNSDKYKKYAEERMFCELGEAMSEHNKVKWGNRSVGLDYEMGEEGRLKIWTIDLDKLTKKI